MILSQDDSRYHTPTLCWDCRNALGGCSWSDHSFTPVEGWKAVPGIIEQDGGRSVSGFHVISCPQFLPDEPRESRK